MRLSNKLPQGWKWVKLAEIAEKPQYGYTESAFSVPIGPKFLRITDITSGEINWETVPYCRCDAKTLKKYKLQPGDILFARSGSVGATILIKDIPTQAIFASYLIRVRLHKDVLPEFVSIALKSPICQSQLVPQGAAQKNINAKLIQDLLLPLPSPFEQKRIVAKINDLLNRLREAKRLRQEAQEEAERLWQSVLADTFPKPGTVLSEGWQWVRLDECITTIESGKRPKGGVRKLKIEKGIFSIGGEHLKWDGGFDLSRPRLIPEEYYFSIKKGKIKPNDILIVKDGATTGKTAYVPENFPFLDACVNEHVFIIRAKKDLILPKYLFLFLLSSFGKKQILSTFHGAAQGGINSHFVKKVFIPVTSLENQKNIVSYLESIKEKIIALKNSQEEVDFEINMLEKIILEKAFRGEL